MQKHKLSRAALGGVVFLPFVLAACAAGAPAQSEGGGGSATTIGGGGSGGTGGAGGAECVPVACDQDCDGVADEGCECLPGDAGTCYSGPEGTDGVGPCKTGTHTCDPATNTFGPCMEEVVPAEKEACDGIDNDCNGQIDDGIPDLVCGVGACMSTAPACVGGQPGVCMAGVPMLEVCNGVDDNCNGQVDEVFPESGKTCDSGLLGVCKPGVYQCLAGALTCVPDKMPGAEACDDLDNDCDGVVDNNILGTGGGCDTGMLGVCGAGTISCQDGMVDCFSDVPASPEVCDGLDNDCDGSIDENNPGGGSACDTGQLGACQQGTLQCVEAGLTCVPNALAQPETCDGADNNCDGQVDEGNPGSGQACSCGGTTTCQNGQFFCQGCTKEVDCNNGIDDNANGSIDCADPQCALGCNADVGPCAAGEKLLVLASTDIPKSIVDYGTALSTITFSETAVVHRVVVQVNIAHTWDNDLEISLKSPTGSLAGLSLGNGSSGDNYSSTIFHDGCPTPITSGSAPFAGCYSPEQPLGAFNGTALQGAWTLQIADTAGGDTGSLSAWTLAMCVQ